MKKEIILGVTGSIAAYKAAEIVSKLRSRGFGLTVIMTESAQKFISPLTFRTLSQNRVITDLFVEDTVYDPQHISLANKAGIFVIAPATANIIGKLASGISDDALTCAVTATEATVLIAPAMDDRMFLNPVTQGNIQKLEGLGYKFVGPGKGRLASGRIGVGRMEEVDIVVQSIINELKDI